MTSESPERLAPVVGPIVGIQTSTYDVGDDALTGMLLWPGCTDTGCVSALVSSSLPGVAVADERIWIFVPVLGTSALTPPTTVDCGSCSIRPIPLLKPGNGTASW